MGKISNIKKIISNIKSDQNKYIQISEMEKNNVVMGTYYYASILDEYFGDSEMISSNITSMCTKSLSINNGDSVCPIQLSKGAFRQYESYKTLERDSNADVIAVFIDVNWSELDSATIAKYYEIYKQYIEYKKTQEGYQKRK